MNKVVIFELIALVVLIILGVLWMLKPEGDFEPFFAFVSLSFIPAELYRRGIFKLPKFRTEDNAGVPCLEEVSDDELLFLEKLHKLALPNNTYNSQSNDLEICISLANKGYFIKENGKFQLTNKCLRYFEKYHA